LLDYLTGSVNLKSIDNQYSAKTTPNQFIPVGSHFTLLLGIRSVAIIFLSSTCKIFNLGFLTSNLFIFKGHKEESLPDSFVDTSTLDVIYTSTVCLWKFTNRIGTCYLCGAIKRTEILQQPFLTVKHVCFVHISIKMYA
jgi:hypothetical protein